LPAELHDFMHDQEVAGEPKVIYDLELVADLAIGARNAFGGRIAVPFRGQLGDEFPQMTHLGLALRYLEIGQLRRDHLEVERALQP
jgi:hypothetical protein